MFILFHAELVKWACAVFSLEDSTFIFREIGMKVWNWATNSKESGQADLDIETWQNFSIIANSTLKL